MKPWMHEIDVKTIEEYLTPETVMLEYGSGTSTPYFLERVKKLVSVEHDKEWFDRVREWTKDVPEDKFIFHLSSVPNPIEGRRWRQIMEEDGWDYLTQYFEEYISSPSLFENTYDVILVDGAHRNHCVEYAAKNLMHESSVLFLHDYGQGGWGDPNIFKISGTYVKVEHVTQTKEGLLVGRRLDYVPPEI